MTFHYSYVRVLSVCIKCIMDKVNICFVAHSCAAVKNDSYPPKGIFSQYHCATQNRNTNSYLATQKHVHAFPKQNRSQTISLPSYESGQKKLCVCTLISLLVDSPAVTLGRFAMTEVN